MLKSKKHNSNEDWARAFDVADKIISKEQIENKINFAVRRLQKTLNGRKPVCCWSGGKDAQVVRLVYERAGYDNFTHGCCPELEYPAFAKWIAAHKPANMAIYEFEPDYDYLNKHSDLIFPKKSASTYWYYTHVNQQAWYKYCKEHGADTLVLGHRVSDGNQCGDNGLMMHGDILKVSPIYDFTHEEIFAAIKHSHLPLPPIYSWKDGYFEGTHTVIARSGKKGNDYAMDAIMEIDPTVLPNLATKIDIIRDYCQRRGIEVSKG